MSDTMGSAGGRGVGTAPYGAGGGDAEYGPGGGADLEELRDRAEDFIRRNPAVSLALALAAGYLVGRMVAGITRRF